MLGYGAGLDKATYSNARQLVEYATESYLVPLYRYIEEELTTQFLGDFEDDTERHQFRFDLSAVRALSEDQDALYARLSVGYKSGWLKRSEVRELAGYEFDAEDEIYAPIQTGGPPVGDDAMRDGEQGGKVLTFKAADPNASGNDAVLDAAIPWLLALGEDEAAKMLKAKPKVTIEHE